MIDRTGAVATPATARKRHGVVVASVALTAGLTAGVLAAPAQAAEALAWSPCVTTAKGWASDDTRSECAMVPVPMDYAQPQGRKIKIAISRLKATDPGKRRGVLVLSPGGPGLVNIDSPLSFEKKGLGGLATDHDLIGFDPRGVGYSDKIACESGPHPVVPPTASPREKEKAYFDREAEFNKRCAAKDIDFVRQLTATNAARDVDAIRAALGESKISFFGVSFGTAIGTNYRSLFDGRVDRMWLDSVMPPVMDRAAMDATFDEVHEKNFDAFLPWIAQHDQEYHFGTTVAAVRKTIFALRDQLDREPRVVDEKTVLDRDWVTGLLGGGPRSWTSSARDLAIVREGGIPRSARPTPVSPKPFGFEEAPGGMNGLQYNAMLCNNGTGGRDFEQLWADKQARTRTYPGTGGSAQFSVWCAAWPLPAEPWKPVKGTSPLQLSGHIDEYSTPYAWSVATRNAVGGTLLTIQDDVHGSLSKLPCAAKAVDFFRTGRTTGGTCPGLR